MSVGAKMSLFCLDTSGEEIDCPSDDPSRAALLEFTDPFALLALAPLPLLPRPSFA